MSVNVPPSIVIRRARLTAEWRRSRAQRMRLLLDGVSHEELEEADYLFQMAMLDLEEAEAKEIQS